MFHIYKYISTILKGQNRPNIKFFCVTIEKDQIRKVKKAPAAAFLFSGFCIVQALSIPPCSYIGHSEAHEGPRFPFYCFTIIFITITNITFIINIIATLSILTLSLPMSISAFSLLVSAISSFPISSWSITTMIIIMMHCDMMMMIVCSSNFGESPNLTVQWSDAH